MGQKVNPHGIRLGIVKTWDAKWYAGKDYADYLLQFYEETYFPDNCKGAGKLSHIKRNQEMINKSDFCLFYYDENYLPPKKNGQKEICLPINHNQEQHLPTNMPYKRKRTFTTFFNKDIKNQYKRNKFMLYYKYQIKIRRKYEKNIKNNFNGMSFALYDVGIKCVWWQTSIK